MLLKITRTAIVDFKHAGLTDLMSIFFDRSQFFLLLLFLFTFV